jgi:hypothetical protein
MKNPTIQYHITEPERSKRHRDKPVVEIDSGLLVIEDCGCNKVVLDLTSAKALNKLLPSLIAILEPLCDGNGAFRFGSIPQCPLK